MFHYLKTMAFEIWTGDFWTSRIKTLGSMIRNPRKFYAGSTGEDWDSDAILLGLTASLLVMVLNIESLFYYLRLFLSLPEFLVGLLCVPAVLAVWLLSQVYFFYVTPYLVAFVLKLMIKKGGAETIRPILFSIAPAGLLILFPVVGPPAFFLAVLFFLVLGFQVVFGLDGKKAATAVILGLIFNGVVFVLLELGLGGAWPAGLTGIGLLAVGIAGGKKIKVEEKDSEINNQKQIDAYFKRLKTPANPKKFKEAADLFQQSSKNALKFQVEDVRDVYGTLMNAWMEDGIVESSSNYAWEMPYECRRAGYERFVGADWPKISKKFQYGEAFLKSIEESVEGKLKLSAQAMEFFALSKDRDPVPGFEK